MCALVQYTESFEHDFRDKHDSEQQDAIDAVVNEIRRVALKWESGALPIEEFDVALDVHQVDPGIWAASWETHNGRLTFSLGDVDANGYADRIILRRVGGHEIYGDS